MRINLNEWNNVHPGHSKCTGFYDFLTIIHNGETLNSVVVFIHRKTEAWIALMDNGQFYTMFGYDNMVGTFAECQEFISEDFDF